MIISSTEELRLYLPANALDSIDAVAGLLDNSEADTLLDKLGQPLYEALCEYYNGLDVDKFISDVATDPNKRAPMDVLLRLSQRIIAYDAMARGIGLQVVSVHSSGVNVGTADDYNKATKDDIDTYRNTCIKETHSSINQLLATLERWCKSSSPDVADIVAKWKKSKYYYLAASMVLPSAELLQQYLDFYENREKFIQMLPDIRYVQEDILAENIGEDLLDYIVTWAAKYDDTAEPEAEDLFLLRVLHYMRKAAAAHLEARTNVLRTSKERKMEAHDEAVRRTNRLNEYISVHQQSFPEDAQQALETSPLYTPPTETPEPYEPKWQNNREGNAIFVVPAMN